MKKGHSPLNLNLIISFKDNKERGHTQLLREIDDFAVELDDRVSEIKGEMEPLFGKDFPLSIYVRALKTTRTYFWRYRGKAAQRKYARLTDPIFQPVVASLHPDQLITLRSMESELLTINANLVVVHALKNALADIAQGRERLAELTSTA
ncbi:hypothetical protein C0068_16690 [Zhongshania marina]|uniref:DUF3158 domain-containing protein n=1 Tax=Zhongshania marina TaxID=2304603 RepID=A0A2S4HC56_9GAMM|nr:hypothetical protein C0068_16690 [Marortus luteolus]